MSLDRSHAKAEVQQREDHIEEATRAYEEQEAMAKGLSKKVKQLEKELVDCREENFSFERQLVSACKQIQRVQGQVSEEIQKKEEELAKAEDIRDELEHELLEKRDERTMAVRKADKLDILVRKLTAELSELRQSSSEPSDESLSLSTEQERSGYTSIADTDDVEQSRVAFLTDTDHLEQPRVASLTATIRTAFLATPEELQQLCEMLRPALKKSQGHQAKNKILDWIKAVPGARESRLVDVSSRAKLTPQPASHHCNGRKLKRGYRG
ncbi:hypothetical protein IE81DRAFT_345472 [Ceraceosorus guamensis]|uniref:Uncharacterized protein n=1 Tax=Ceraceosorus guamensis TaxID=1522189 RepID=A0A316W591_9BASI|nr:hypothetical protein IE81DRAFT_345472 [Ceraceosorus guamensis]PWN44784.1 hypothetical protein IE81DRAFT_345472 [Ceraceosorus guamensis]